MTKKKASMSQVLADIKPYITKKFMAAPCIKEQDIQAICQILLPRYENVQLIQGLTNNKPDFRIQVKGLFGTEEKRFEVVCGNNHGETSLLITLQQIFGLLFQKAKDILFVI